MKVKLIHTADNEPFPNNTLPVIFYEAGLADVLLDEAFTSEAVLNVFANNGYTNGWTGGILKKHHFHSNTHEALACIKGEAQVQLGGPHADIHTIRAGDVVLLPAGVAHKKLDSSEDFTIVGAYPDGKSYDMQYGEAPDYQAVLDNIASVPLPATDPVLGSPGEVEKHWKN